MADARTRVRRATAIGFVIPFVMFLVFMVRNRDVGYLPLSFVVGLIGAGQWRMTQQRAERDRQDRR